MFAAKKSCDEIILRVQRDPLLNRSIVLLFDDVFNRQRLITELTTEPPGKAKRQANAEANAATCAISVTTFHAPGSVFSDFSAAPDQQNAGFAPAFFSRAPLATRSCARRAEFISVSGQCAARSAHYSDLRNHKRISGGVAATEHLRAPMNSPTGVVIKTAGQRVSSSTSAKCIEGDSSWL